VRELSCDYLMILCEWAGSVQVPTGACEQFVLALFVHMFSLVKAVTSSHSATAAAGAESNNQITVMLRFDQLTHRF